MQPEFEKTEDRLVAALLRPQEQTGAPAERTRLSARLTLLDSVGVGLGTLDHPAAVVARRHVQTYMSAPAEAGVWGGGGSVSVEGAVLANSVPLRCYDYNDVMFGASGQGGHPSDFVPGLFAAAEAAHLPGRALIDAVIIAYDAAKILFDTLNVTRRGWDYACLTGLAAVSGFASLAGLSPEQGRHALGIYASSHIGTNQLESGHLDTTGNLTMWKRFNGAEATLAALRACRLAASGVEAPLYSLLGENGFLRQLAMTPGGAEEIMNAIDAALRLEVHGVDVNEFKRWPVGTRAQSAIEAALDCRKRISSPSAIERVVVEAEEGVVKHLVREQAWRPYSRETADHSLPYVVAVALLAGDVALEHFNDDAFITSEPVRALLDRIEIESRPASGGRSAYPVRVRVVADGTEHVATGAYPPEEIRAIPFRDRLEEKFTLMATRCFDEDHVGRIREAVMGVDELDDVGRLGALLSAPAR